MLFYNKGYIIIIRRFSFLHYCEICGKPADIHHIIHKCEGGIDFELNYKYLCPYHHRGKLGPHKNFEIDLHYKITLQSQLENLLSDEFYTLEQLCHILKLNSSTLKKISKNLKRKKEGYLARDIILFLMGNNYYSEEILEDLLLEKLL
jgi:hypothetical protein